MDREIITYYKLQLAHDLLMFLTGLSVDGLQQEAKAEKINTILEVWEQRINTQVKALRKQKIEEACATTGDDVDVLSILADVSALETDLVKKEFKVEARHSMFRCFNGKE